MKLPINTLNEVGLSMSSRKKSAIFCGHLLYFYIGLSPVRLLFKTLVQVMHRLINQRFED